MVSGVGDLEAVKAEEVKAVEGLHVARVDGTEAEVREVEERELKR